MLAHQLCLFHPAVQALVLAAAAGGGAAFKLDGAVTDGIGVVEDASEPLQDGRAIAGGDILNEHVT